MNGAGGLQNSPKKESRGDMHRRLQLKVLLLAAQEPRTQESQAQERQARCLILDVELMWHPLIESTGPIER